MGEDDNYSLDFMIMIFEMHSREYIKECEKRKEEIGFDLPKAMSSLAYEIKKLKEKK